MLPRGPHPRRRLRRARGTHPRRRRGGLHQRASRRHAAPGPDPPPLRPRRRPHRPARAPVARALGPPPRAHLPQHRAGSARRRAGPGRPPRRSVAPRHRLLRPPRVRTGPRRFAAPRRRGASAGGARVNVYAGFPRDAIEMPCFDRTTSIKLKVSYVGFTQPPAGGFPALESLHLENCNIDLVDLLPRCPRLRKLVIFNCNSDSVIVESPSLQVLSVSANVEIRHINITAPALKVLYLDAYRGISKNDFSLSYSAPAVEDLTWKRNKCEAISDTFGAIWCLFAMSLSTSLQPRPGFDIEGTCLHQRPLFHALWLHLELLDLETDVGLFWRCIREL